MPVVSEVYRLELLEIEVTHVLLVHVLLFTRVSLLPPESKQNLVPIILTAAILSHRQ